MTVPNRVASLLIVTTVIGFGFLDYQLHLLDAAEVERGRIYLVPIPLGLIEPDIPKDNQLTIEKIELGKRLFFDKRISLNNSRSCASCHDPNHGFAEPRPVSISANGQTQRRNSPSILNTGYLPTTMWDGRMRTLEEQALDPFSTWGDMGIEIGDALDRIQQDETYRVMFRKAFGDRPTSKGFSQAVASYQRSLVSGNTRFDKYLYGEQPNALSKLEKE